MTKQVAWLVEIVECAGTPDNSAWQSAMLQALLSAEARYPALLSATRPQQKADLHSIQ